MILALLLPLNITIHCNQTIRRDADRFFGINLNYVRDRDSNRPGERPLNEALMAMGTRWLRYPGGEKSDFYLWSKPPYAKPIPQSLGWYATQKGDRMDFDEFVQHARATHAEPHVVVACDSEKRNGLTETQQLENATEWVRYSKAKGYGVKYWEVGNENWHNNTSTPTEMAKTLIRFSKAMKAIDPTIKIGASGDSDHWWQEFLPKAAPYLDFLTVSQYTGWEWRTYDHFLTGPNLTETATGAVNAVTRFAPEADRTRLKVIVSETNAKDYSPGGWSDSNDLGHALVTFSTLGRLLLDPKVGAAMVWTTRWMDDAEASSSPFYGLNAKNELMTTAQAIRAWGHYVLPDLLGVDGSDNATEAFASRSDSGDSLTVWLVNRSRSLRDVNLSIEGEKYQIHSTEAFSGDSDKDLHPKWVQINNLRMNETGQIRGPLAPLSISILVLRRS